MSCAATQAASIWGPTWGTSSSTWSRSPRLEHTTRSRLYPTLLRGYWSGSPGSAFHQAAVSDSNGEAEFQFVENDPAYSGVRRRVYDRPDPRVVTIRVPVATVDETIPAGQPIAFMKIDIEGGEYHAIKGAVSTIRQWQPVIVFEAGSRSTGQYGVTAATLYDLVTKTLGYELSTMGRWLGRGPAMTLQEFSHNWDNGPDFYFIATRVGALAEPAAAPDGGGS